ncbi:MAG: hypothetical protein A3B96_03845 [Candidatus Spechtbacteria bacterium RIFCSPHIGHO2_02_FULL_43_15b]|uniref:Type II secretion system protein GspI C-terminal domain-containing protein n=1 Tax=Candidatus Spechtbacteria bacterium RIFCSPHIGHO2_01_FULL_43_30 TaxID=1802158 RepID=A0A1G2H850_9BACT|nr:MAG: hypothetical protein A2827_03365 [Candidatus Spechtbacteria bacterium RIFCSPHIGHO2_01_FULL_43_30]OGZ59141.1 MAG: hypothetical protein A3B96_03845 [Candidatus Spechtbacteria bacterium RIFCSPHIGHO2_02_FULL_43_15b]
MLKAKFNKGFTLIELSIAVFVLAVGISGMLALINRLVISGTQIQQQLIASGLAQEGIEVTHNIRNTNWIQDKDWNEGLDKSGCSTSPLDTSNCPILATVNFDSSSISENSDPDDWELPWDGSNYKHSSGGIFSRHLEISYDSDDDGDIFMRVKSIVDWRGKSFETEELLYDWE